VAESPTILQRFFAVGVLIAIALVTCVVIVSTYIFAELHHINPAIVFLAGVSVIFLAAVREEYRKEFRSPRFVLFVLGWLALNLAIIIGVLGSFGWLYLIPALFIEHVMFYISAYWVFGIQPPGRRSRS
jgi:hypothetical protein